MKVLNHTIQNYYNLKTIYYFKEIYYNVYIKYVRGGISLLYLKTEELKLGMRLAKPIYNSAGVLLYNRNTTINERVYEQIQSMNLYGLYILEPAEPLPPIDEVEMEFERFQTISCGMLQEILIRLLTIISPSRLNLCVWIL